MRRTRTSSREFWIAIGVSVALHVCAGVLFWVTWEPAASEKAETQVEWTWSAPTPEKNMPGRSLPPGTGADQPIPAPGAQPAKEVPAAESGSVTGKAAPSTGLGGSKEAALSDKTPGSAEGTAKGTPTQSNQAVGGATSSSAIPSGTLTGVEGPVAGESTGYALVPPRLRARPSIQFPTGAAQAGLSGNVLLLVEVLENGRVGKIVVSRSSGSRILDEAAKDNVAQWQFDPAWEPQGKKHVRVMSSVWVRFVKEGS